MLLQEEPDEKERIREENGKGEHNHDLSPIRELEEKMVVDESKTYANANTKKNLN